MERIIITPNRFKPSSEIRRDVVEKICETVLHYINELDDDYVFLIKNRHPSLYLGVLKDNRSNYEPLIITLKNDYNYRVYEYIRIRTCEMKKVFELLQDAGYYIYDNNWEYQISKRPYLGEKKATHVEFGFFID